MKPEYKDKADNIKTKQAVSTGLELVHKTGLFPPDFHSFSRYDIVLAEHKNYFFILFGRSELVTCINLFTPYWSETFRRTKVWIQMVPKGSHSSKLTHSNVTLRESDVHDVSTKDTRLDKRLPDPSLELITYPTGGAWTDLFLVPVNCLWISFEKDQANHLFD